jgi:hypothetical protein
MKRDNIKSLIIGLLFYATLAIIMFACKPPPVPMDNKELTLIIETIEEEVEQCPDATLYEYNIDFLKECEGYKATKYRCDAGHLTIGYGHLYLKTDTFTYLTEHQADSLLRYDLNIRVALVNQRYPYLKYHEKLALANFIFIYGTKDLAIVCEDIERVMGYKYYTKDDELVKSWLLLTRSKFILDMYSEHWFED